MKISKEAENVLKTIEKYQPIRPKVLMEKLNISEKTMHKHLARLLDENLITKTGNNGKTFYYIKNKNEDEIKPGLLNLEDLLIEQNYIYVSPTGEIIRGLNGFNKWCQANNTNFEKQKRIYTNRLKEIGQIKQNGVISAKDRILSGKIEIALDHVFFSDFYTFDHFGKTKLGQLIYVAKNSQNIELIREISSIIKPSILNIIHDYKIKMVCYIPPTIDRKIQIMEILEKSLALNLPTLKIEKVASKTKIAQKTLRKLEDRITNAKNTLAIDPNQNILGNVLIIDDATGSGATLNETAIKIKEIATKPIKIIGFTVVGSYKGFDVISEV